MRNLFPLLLLSILLNISTLLLKKVLKKNQPTKKLLSIFSGLLLLGVAIFPSNRIFSQSFYAIDTIQKIEISFSQSNWDYILDTAKQGSDSYTMSQWVKINGVQFDSAGVKYKGNSSYNPSNVKNPLHIELDHFKSQDYMGYKDIKLSNGYNEPSFVREVLLYSIFQNYAEASRANFAQTYINGQYFGLYTNVEAVTKTFLNDRFFSDNNTFVFGDNGGCDLRYKGNDSTLYYNPYTLKSNDGWTDLVNLCNTLKNNINGIENILDVDRTLWLHAYTNATVTLDSYIGGSTHNYYIYEDHNGRFNPIIWDLNGGFGVFNKAYPTGPVLTITQMQNMDPLLHLNDSIWPLVKNLLAIPMYKRMYIAHMKTIMTENIDNSSYFNTAQYLQTIIDTAVQSDPNKFGTYSQFTSNLTTDAVIGPKTIPGITSLMSVRNIYLNSTTEFQQIPPTISNITPSDTFPLINSNVYITANIVNATAVYLGRRYSVLEKFTRVMMYDDGTNGDGAAGDGVYGISLPVTSSNIQYYIYAENTNAGIFSPVRAEHEYYSIAVGGDVVLNELSAINSSIQADQNGEFDDWIELYNNTSSPIVLDGYYLSDESTNLTKWTFPVGTTISANGFLIIWADNDTTQLGLHTNFKLSSSGESIYLSNSSVNLINETTFGTQTTDVTWGRYPNGTGSFNFLNPTYSANNSNPISIAEITTALNDVLIYPNPAADKITIKFLGNEKIRNISIYDITCKELITTKISSNQTIDTSNLPNGIYIILIGKKTVKKLIINK